MVEIKPRAASLAALLCVLVGAVVPSANAQGMRIVRDPVTGQLRAPTAEEYQALQAEEAKAAAARKATAPAAAPAPVRRADGSVQLMLDESQMSYSVVTRNADGSLTEQCVTGAAEAQKALSGKKVSVVKSGKAAAKEHSHDHE